MLKAVKKIIITIRKKHCNMRESRLILQVRRVREIVWA